MLSPRRKNDDVIPNSNEYSLACSITNALTQILTEIGFLFAKEYELSTLAAKAC